MGAHTDHEPQHPRSRRIPTSDLTLPQVLAIRALMDVAFGSDEDERFTDDDWAHSVGGVHFVLEFDGSVVGHASVVEREIHVGGRPLRTGYVEAVAVAPEHQGAGLGSLVMDDASAYIRDAFELGVLGTGRHHFYERLGWVTWKGPAFVRSSDGERRTPDEEGYILVLPTPTSPSLDLAARISCDWRPGDVW